LRLSSAKSSRRGPDFFLIFRKPPFGQQPARFEENLAIRMPQMAAEQTRLLYNQSSWRNAATSGVPDSL
jgi:hypothetical protein